MLGQLVWRNFKTILKRRPGDGPNCSHDVTVSKFTLVDPLRVSFSIQNLSVIVHYVFEDELQRKCEAKMLEISYEAAGIGVSMSYQLPPRKPINCNQLRTSQTE